MRRAQTDVFTYKIKPVPQSDWLDGVMSEIEAANEKLAEIVGKDKQYPWWEIITNINAHNAHHGGQIVVMRKLQGSWDASKGVS
jgi:hypothetical protein